MSSTDVFYLILIALLTNLLPAIGLYGMFKKAGEAGWKAFLPFYNLWVMMGIAQRPKYWFFLQFIPIVGWFIALGILIEFVKTYGKFKFYEHVLTVCTAG
ncbi:MAG: S26 family signal peptidase, partial [Bacteroidetes bacterium]|nr:S26 family signal peptidase [Bacteroidota bacterium]